MGMGRKQRLKVIEKLPRNCVRIAILNPPPACRSNTSSADSSAMIRSVKFGSGSGSSGMRMAVPRPAMSRLPSVRMRMATRPRDGVSQVPEDEDGDAVPPGRGGRGARMGGWRRGSGAQRVAFRPGSQISKTQFSILVTATKDGRTAAAVGKRQSSERDARALSSHTAWTYPWRLSSPATAASPPAPPPLPPEACCAA